MASAEQRRCVRELRDTLDALPPDLPDGIVDDLHNLTLELKAFIERSQSETEQVLFVHARDRE